MISLFAVFLIICGIGFIFLMISLLIGDLFEALDFDLDIDGSDGQFGMLDSRVISVFLTAFGALAALTIQYGFGTLAAVGAGLLGGLIFGAIVFGFGYVLYSQQSTSNVSNRDLVGRTAKVIVGIKPGEIGQISCTVGEERVEKLARVRGDKELAEGTMVLIEEAGSESFIVSSMEGYELPE